MAPDELQPLSTRSRQKIGLDCRDAVEMHPSMRLVCVPRVLATKGTLQDRAAADAACRSPRWCSSHGLEAKIFFRREKRAPRARNFRRRRSFRLALAVQAFDGLAIVIITVGQTRVGAQLIKRSLDCALLGVAPDRLQRFDAILESLFERIGFCFFHHLGRCRVS